MACSLGRGFRLPESGQCLSERAVCCQSFAQIPCAIFDVSERNFIAVGREAFFAQRGVQAVDVFLFEPCFFAGLAQFGETAFLLQQAEGIDSDELAQPKFADLRI